MTTSKSQILSKIFLGIISFGLFILSGIITSLILNVPTGSMIMFSSIILIYWLISVPILRIYNNPNDLKGISLKTGATLFVIMIIAAVQQLMFIKIQFNVSFIFFAIVLILMFIWHFVYFSFIYKLISKMK